MPLDTNFNVNPYYDDYDEDKKFLRMLFKPGYAVQARELTQLQTILQKQVDRFGQHVFKNGSVVTGGQFFLQDATYLKLETTYSGLEVSANNFVGQTILSVNESKRAEVIKVYETDLGTGDPKTLLVKQLYGDPFASGETIKTNEVSPVFANVQADGVGTGQIFSVNEGVFFYEGLFIKNDAQTIATSKYNNNSANVRIGFEIVESIVDASSDTSLLDPAQNASNYQAPGADRFKIDLVLSSRDISSEDDEKFIELLRLEKAVITREYKYPIYSVIEETLARRTYDESGNYTVRPFKISLETNSTNTAQTDVILSPGKAYVYGFEFETNAPTTITIDKPRQTENVQNKRITSEYGYYVYSNNHIGTFPINSLATVDIHCVAQTSINTATTGAISNTKIGTARIKAVEFDSASNTSNSKTYEYKTFLFDINVNQSIVGNVISSTSNTNVVLGTVGSNVLSTVDQAYRGAKLRIVAGNGSGQPSKTITNWNATTQTATLSEAFVGTLNSSSRFSIEFEVKDAESLAVFNSTTLVASANIDDRSKDSATPYQDVFISDTKLEPIIFRLGQQYITQNTISDMTFSYRRLYSGQSFSSSESPALPVGSGEDIASAATTTAKAENYYIAVTTAGTSPYAVGEVIPSDKISVDVATRKLTIVNANNMTANIIATINSTLPTRKNKTYISANTTIQSSGGVDVFANAAVTTYGTQGQTHIAAAHVNKVPNISQSLHVSDVADIVSVLDFEGAVISEANASGATDVTSKYIFDNGQRDSFYDHASIRLRPNVRPPVGPLVVKYNRFTSSGAGFFTVDSYSTIDYGDIPVYVSPTNNDVFELRDCIDFRPVRADSASGTGTSVIFDVDPTTTGPKISKLADDIILDYSYYLPRIDKVILNKNKTFGVTQGVSLLNPPVPNDKESGMTLYILRNPPYVANTADIQVEYVNNKRYTMRDIGTLEKRIENLEYYTSLSLLEQDAISKQDLTILDSQNLPRFKNGILVDSFDGSSVADITDVDYKASIDPVRKELRPTFNIYSYSLTFDSANSTNFLQSGPLITANAASVTLIDQAKASKAINVNPFNVINYLGKIQLNPTSDIWIDTQAKADVLVNLNGDKDAWELLTQNAAQTEWGSWGTTWTGVSTSSFTVQNNRTISQNGGRDWQVLNAGVGGANDVVRHTTRTVEQRQSRSGVLSQVVPQTITQTLGDRVVDISIIPYMRSVNVLFVGTDFKPDTTVYPFFDGSAVENNVGNRVNKFYLANNNIQLKRTIADPETITIRNTATNTANGTGIVAHISNNIVYVTNVVPTSGFDFANSTGQIVGQSTGQTYTITGYEHNGANAAAATSSTITLRLDAAGAKNVSGYNSAPIFIVQGTGVGQQRTITSYNPSTRVATVTPSWTTTPDTTSFYSIGRPRTDESGSVVGIFTIPTGRFRIGEKLFRLTDSSTGDVPSSTTTGDASFFAQGLLQTTEETIISTTVPTIQRTTVNDNRVVSETTTTNRTVTWTDPLAQTFLVSPVQYPQGLFVSKIRVCFKTKDSVVPVTLQVRPAVNGYPSSSVIYPYGSVTLTPDKVKITESPSLDDPAKYTEFVFDAPLYMQPGEHSFVLLANSNKYEMFVAEIGKLDVTTGRQISEQPYGGSLFLSQNGSTWTADQSSDMMFRIFRYQFSTTPVNAQFLVNFPDVAANPYDLAHLITADVSVANTSLNYEFNSEALTGGYVGYKPITPLVDYDMNDGAGIRGLLPSTGNATFILKSTLGTLNQDVTPFIDITRLGFLSVHNQINDLELSNSDIAVVSGGSGYANSSDVTVLISGGGGSGATAEANVVSGVIDNIYIVDPGSGYTGSPTITITPGSGGGSGAEAVVIGETDKRGGPALARYITRRVTLNDGFDSGDLRVYMTAYKPIDGDIYVYAKLLSSSDPEIFDEKEWQLLTQLGNANFVSLNANDYRELVFAPGTNGIANNSVTYTSGSSTFNTFRTFAIKIVMSGTSSVDVPKVRDLRVIALPAG
jgi:hypothetical protein